MQISVHIITLVLEHKFLQRHQKISTLLTSCYYSDAQLETSTPLERGMAGQVYIESMRVSGVFWVL